MTLAYTTQPTPIIARTLAFTIETQLSLAQHQQPQPLMMAVYDAQSHSLVQKILSPLQQTEIGATSVLHLSTTEPVTVAALNEEGDAVSFSVHYQLFLDCKLTDISITAGNATAVVTMIYTD